MTLSLPFLNTVSGRSKAFLARQLSTMLLSGLPLNAAVRVLALQTSQETMKVTLNAVLQDLESGASFSQAAAKHPPVFSNVFVSVIVSGEQVGRLAEVLAQLADQLERDADFVGKVRGALYYPAFIVIAMVLVAVVMMVTIVPQLEDIFTQANASLPLVTQAIVWASRFLAKFWWLVLIVVVGVAVYLMTYLRSRAGERVIARLSLWLPTGLGTDIAMARMTRTLGMLVQAGTPILEAIRVTGSVVDNVYYQEALEEAAEQVKRGIPLSEPLKKSRLFPPIVSQMVTVGEQTGQLDKVLGNLATFYEEESDTKITRLASLVEPAIIVIVGIGVGLLVYSILVPIYNIAQLS